MAKVSGQGDSLVLITYDIENYKNCLIEEYKLQELDDALVSARNHGLKVILRVAYGFKSKSREPNNLDLIEEHFNQIAPIITSNIDSIFVVQAEILGPWGEWHNSSFGDPPNRNARVKIVDLWLNILKDDTYIALRRPSFIRDLYVSENLNGDNAYSGEGIARISWYNDALLSSDSDMGTYTDWTRKDELDWSENHNLYVPLLPHT